MGLNTAVFCSLPNIGKKISAVDPEIIWGDNGDFCCYYTLKNLAENTILLSAAAVFVPAAGVVVLTAALIA